MKKFSNQSKYICHFLLNVTKNIALGQKIDEKAFDKLTQSPEFSNEGVILLKLISCFKSLYQTFSKHKIEIDNQIICFLDGIMDCIRFAEKKEHFNLKKKVIILQKNLFKVRKELSLSGEDFIGNIKFDRIYSEVDEILLAFEEISSEIKNRRKL